VKKDVGTIISIAMPNKVIVDSNFALVRNLSIAYLLVFIAEQNLAGVYVDSAVMHAILALLRNTHDATEGPLSVNMTSSTKPEVAGVYSQRRQRRIKPRPQSTSTENSAKFPHVVFNM